MTTVRELLISFQTEVDPDSLNKADRKVKSFADTMQTVLSGAALISLGKGLLEFNEFASDAKENLNVINASFQESAQSVLDWSSNFSDAAGRNKYEMQEIAGTLGAILNPMMNKNSAEAAMMSTRLAELAVDLGSFFNAADNEVLVALKSGLTGASEPLRRFGVVMTEATLKEYAREKGIRKNIKNMSIAEKTALRYNFILEKTSNAQGDAIKTSEGWANSKKAVISKLKELATNIGLILLPVMTKMSHFARMIITGFQELTKNTHLMESALIAFGTVAAAIGVKLLIAFAPVLLPMLKLAAIIALVAIALDDLWTFVEGGDSIIGRLIDSMFGPGSASEASKKLREMLKELKKFIVNEVIPGIKVFARVLLQLGKDFAPIGKALMKNMGDALKNVWGDWKVFIDWMKETAMPTLGRLWRFIVKVTAPLQKLTGIDLTPKLIKKDGQVKGGLASTVGKGSARKKTGVGLPNLASFNIQNTTNANSNTQSNVGGTTNNFTSTTNVEVKGAANTRTASDVANAASNGMAGMLRASSRALTQGKKK